MHRDDNFYEFDDFCDLYSTNLKNNQDEKNYNCMIIYIVRLSTLCILARFNPLYSSKGVI